jgi:hypothetical protein
MLILTEALGVESTEFPSDPCYRRVPCSQVASILSSQARFARHVTNGHFKVFFHRIVP